MNLHELNQHFYGLQGDKSKSEIFATFKSGDVILVHEKIIDEKKKERTQKFQGILIRKRGSLLGENILLREKLKNHWVEKAFFIHSPLVQKIERVKEGRSRRAYLSYLRDSKSLPIKLKRLKGKAAFAGTR
ncbi:50S ribosomal protein L19 [Candidatus Mycoplasma haematolamae str. Purdue]|uniref:50S ribosomal protein L19 n=1 Tax=Mycoplasma haematolamae (strain Purdue) TaxID=1212765 RepID=I7CFU2_MYCHA|nr:50S ribosomal protein L19 [Candidatus Mycoplasma haematolamae]AFO52091.1 50S ribosomal protein L19 [Candidatus Mycoplasma haematolamae str. Purdue]